MSVLTVTNSGTVYDLDTAPYTLIDYDGFGMPPVQRFGERAPNQNGNTDRGFLLDPRFVLIKILHESSTLALAQAAHLNLLSAFYPVTNSPLVLKYTLTSGAIRALDCYYTGGLPLASSEMRTFHELATIELIANDPTWYNPTLQTSSWNLSILSELSFPTVGFPIEFGSDIISATQTINYAGTYKTFPVIVFTGPLTSPLITNTTTGYTIQLNTTLAAGQSARIDCRWGVKTCLRNDGTNLSGYLSAASDLDFYLASAPESAGGANILTVSGAGAVAAQSSIQIEYYERFLGV